MDSNVSDENKVFVVLDDKSWTYDFIAGFIAFIMFIPDHIASVSSRHLAVAFNIPKHTTGIYFTKLLSFRSLVMLFASLSTYIIKWFIPENNIILTLAFNLLILISRFILFILLYFSKNLALDVYNVMIFDSLSIGLFQLTFYTLTPEYVSLVSLSFKIAKISVFFVQLTMDMLIYDQPFLMIKIMFLLTLVLTFLSTFCWIYYCFAKVNNKNYVPPTENVVLEIEDSQSSYLSLVNTKKIENTETNCLEESEPKFFEHLKNAFSPFMMCLVSIMMKVILYPGILPYALLERDKCHKINMALIPMSLLGCFTIHIIKKKVKSINKRWKWYWHLFWIFTVPMFIVVILTFASLHTDSVITKRILNSRNSVLCMAVFFFFFYNLVETLGFVGVVSNVKHYGKILERGIRMISTNQVSALVVGFIFYKISVGYNVTRSFLNVPYEKTPSLSRFFWWVGLSIKSGFKDFINDFRLNIKDYI